MHFISEKNLIEKNNVRIYVLIKLGLALKIKGLKLVSLSLIS